jgi:hypothetical protein
MPSIPNEVYKWCGTFVKDMIYPRMSCDRGTTLFNQVVPPTWSIVVCYVPQDGTQKVKRLIFTIDGLAITLLPLSLPFLRQEILSSIPLVYMPSRRVDIVHSYTGDHIQIPFFWLQEATLIGPSPKKGNH